MRLRRLTLRNVCQHETLDWQFQDGLVAVLGQNGGGKSNALNAAYACLSGDFSRHSAGKNGYIRQQAGEDEPSFIEVAAEHGGTPFTLTRYLRPNKQSLALDGQTFSKAADIRQALEEVLGITPQLLDAYVFVAQWQMFSFISTPAERAKQFAQLCRTQHAERCWELVGRQIDLDRSIADQVVDNSDELKQQRAGYLSELGALCDRQTAIVSERLLSEPVQSHYREVQRAWLRCQDLDAAIAREIPIERARFAQAKEAVAGWKRQTAARDAVADETARLQEEQQAAREQLAMYDTQLRRWRWHQNLQRDLDSLAVPEAPVEPDVPSRDDSQQEEKWLERLIERYESLLDGCEGKLRCPTCGTLTETLQDTMATAREALPGARKALAAVREDLATLAAFERRTVSYKRAKAVYDARREQLIQQLAEMGEVTEPDGDVAEAAKHAVDAWRTSRDQLYREDEELGRALVYKARRKTEHKTSQARLEQLRQERESIVTSEAEVREAEARLADHLAAERELSGLREREATLRQVCEDIEKRLRSLETRLARSATARQWLGLLEPVREVFHRDRLPHQVHLNAMEDLEDRINSTLALSSTDFTIAAGGSLDLVARFRDRTVTAAADLSGAQKMVLALAFRLAVNALFASQIGLLVLDEPTAALDAQNTEKLVDVFVGLGRIARSCGHQIIVITHEELLRPVFDQVLRVGTV